MVNCKKQPEGVLVQKPKTFTPEHKGLFQRRQLGSKNKGSEKAEIAILTDTPIVVSV